LVPSAWRRETWSTPSPPSASERRRVSVPEYKGLPFNSTIAALAKLVGPERFARFKDAIPKDTLALIDTPPAASEWIELKHLDRTYRTALTVCFSGDRDGMFQLGHLKFTNDLRGVYKMFIKLFDPPTVLGKSPAVYATYMRNNGRAIAGECGKTFAMLAWDGVRIGSPAFWSVQQGMSHAIAEATRMKDVKTAFTKGGEDESASELKITWTR
jgi:hypothetical protein